MEQVRFALVDYDKFSRHHTRFVAEVLKHEIVRQITQPSELVESIRDIRAGELAIDMFLCSTEAVTKRSARSMRALGQHVVRYDPPTNEMEKLEEPTRRDIFQVMDEIEELEALPKKP